MKLWNATKNFVKDEDGAALIEYVTLMAVVLGGSVAALTLLGTDIGILFNKVDATIKAQTTTW